MSILDSMGRKDEALRIAAAYVEALRGELRDRDALLERAGMRASEQDAKIAKEQRRRGEAEARSVELEDRLEEAAQGRSAADARIVELEERVADLDLDKGVLERRLGRALDEVERVRRENGGDDEAVRRRVLRQQAVRARLAKTDMSAWARLQTLQQAGRVGVALDDDQEEELQQLRERYG